MMGARDVFTFTFTRYGLPEGAGTVSLCYGHLDYETFKEAFHYGGVFKGVVFMKEALTHEWWRRPAPELWEESEKGAPNALPVTVLRW